MDTLLYSESQSSHWPKSKCMIHLGCIPLPHRIFLLYCLYSPKCWLPLTTNSLAMCHKGLKGDNQCLELHPEENWKPVQFMLEEQMAAVAMWAFAHICLGQQLRTFLDLEALQSLMPWSPPVWITAMQSIWEYSWKPPSLLFFGVGYAEENPSYLFPHSVLIFQDFFPNKDRAVIRFCSFPHYLLISFFIESYLSFKRFHGYC